MVLSTDTVFFRISRSRRTAGVGRSLGQLTPHRVLRVSRHETDPVRIILAAQIQLRRWRLADSGTTPCVARQRIRQIVAARDELIGRVVVPDAILTNARKRQTLSRPRRGVEIVDAAAAMRGSIALPAGTTVAEMRAKKEASF